MGYEAIYVPTEEKMKEYKPWNEESAKSDDAINFWKYELISYCMNKPDKAASKIYKQLGFYLRGIAHSVKEREKYRTYFRWKEDENHEVNFCGWGLNNSYRDADEFIIDYQRSLFILTELVRTPSYFRSKDNFQTKLDDIEENISNFIESVEDATVHEIVEDLNEFKVKESY